MMNSAVILADSHPAQKEQIIIGLSRTMLPALGKPLIARVMDQLYRAGIRHFVIVLDNHDGEVAAYLNNNWVPDAHLEFVLRNPHEHLLPYLVDIATRLDHPFLMTTYNNFVYDTFISNLVKQHQQYPQHLVISGARKMLSDSDDQVRYFASVDADGVINSISPAIDINTFFLNDLSICGSNFITYLKSSASSGQETSTYYLDIVRAYFEQQIQSPRLVEASWIFRVNSDLDLLRLNRQLLSNSNDAHILSELPRNVRIIPPVRIDPLVSVGQNAVIGPNVYLEKGARIGESSHIENAVILERAYIPPNSHINNAIVSYKGTLSG